MFLIYSWLCAVSFVFSSLYWKDDYVEWHIWFSVIFSVVYISVICVVCVYQAIFQNKVCPFTTCTIAMCISLRHLQGSYALQWCSDVILGSIIFVVIAILFGAHPMQ